jgi:ABC-type uncharacterized transport system, ATPase component
MELLRGEALTKHYGDHKALDGVDLSVPQGRIFGLLGPNGAGKTTLLRLINQMLFPDAGALFWEGEPLRAKHLPLIGYLPEERGLYAKMRVGEQLLYLGRLRGMSKAEAANELKTWLSRFDLTDWTQKPLQSLSKGMAQKVQFIAAVMHRPRLLILDEPLSGFDPINAQAIVGEMEKLRAAGTTILLSTHRMESVQALCDQIVLLHQGKIILQGGTQALREQCKAGIYRFRLRPEALAHLPEDLECLEKESLENAVELRLRCSEAQAQTWGSEMMQRGWLLAFTEELPSLQDIFVEQIQAA